MGLEKCGKDIIYLDISKGKKSYFKKLDNL